MDAYTFSVFLFISFVTSVAYGASLSISNFLKFYGYDPTLTGSVITPGVVMAMLFFLANHKLSRYFDAFSFLFISVCLIFSSMLSFSLINISYIFVHLGGLLLGLGWVIFFINTPLYLIQQASQKKSFQYLTQSSGAQLAGAGLSALIFNPLAGIFQSHSLAFLLYFSLSIIVLPCFLLLKKRKLKFEGGSTYSRKLSFCSTSIPMAMIAILAGIYSGVTLFQQIYAESRSLNAETFFSYFTLICVFCRLFLPKLLPRENIRNLVFILLFLLTSSIVVFMLNSGSPFLYVVSTCLFSLGYCFLYSLLHEVALRKKLNIVDDENSVSKLFSLFYFIGLFGFPWFAGNIIKMYGIEQMFSALLLLLFLNFIFLYTLMPNQKHAP